jgi:anaerobic selenocysteine-containing dehydrogenase
MGLAPGILPGRVGLEEGRAWFEHHWSATLPTAIGLDTAGILDAASRGRIGGLVLLGADPRADFPDAGAALRGMSGARFVVAVDTHVTESIRRHADVVLPASAWAERRGTFTNVEGRITWLSQLVTPKGMSWPDWMIASEISTRLGTDLGFARQEDIWAEVTEVSPLHRGATYALIEDLNARDGIVVPVGDAPLPRRPRTLDPMADPGIASAELHNIAPTSMLLRASAAVSMDPEPDGDVPPSLVVGDEERRDPEAVPSVPDPARAASAEFDEAVGPAPPAPPRLGTPAVAPPEPPTAGAVYGSPGAPPAGSVQRLRLVARRRLWDGGTQVKAVPALRNLHPAPNVLVHPSVLAELGLADGETVRVSSSRGTLMVPASGDKSISEGTALIDWNIPGARAGDLVDGASAYTEVTISPVPVQGGGADGP